MAGDHAAVSAHILSPSCEFPGFCVLELNPDVSSPSPPPNKYPQTKRESNPSSLHISGGVVFGGRSPVSMEGNVAARQRPIKPAVDWVSMDIPGQTFPEKYI